MKRNKHNWDYYERHEYMCWAIFFGLYDHASFIMGESSMTFEDKIAYIKVTWRSLEGNIHGYGVLHLRWDGE